MDRLYDDKLDEKISKKFYERKFKQYAEEKEKVTEAIKRHSNTSNKYFELGINVYELSQKVREIYLKAKKEKNIIYLEKS